MFTALPAVPVANAFWDAFVGFFERGGPFMVPLAVCAVAAVVISILRVRALQRERVLPRFLRAAIEKLTPGTDVGHLWRLVDENPAALARITRAGLQQLDQSRDVSADAVQIAARREIVRLEGGLSALELIVGISPLLGLLGAISGLVGVFSDLGANGGLDNPAADTGGVALGIAEALNTTIFGLAIAIPTLVVYTFFNRRVERLAVEMESLLAGLISKCFPDGGEMETGGVYEEDFPRADDATSFQPGIALQAKSTQSER